MRATLVTAGPPTELTGRGQCTDNQFALGAATLGKLAACLTDMPAMLARGDDRFDLEYFWGLALKETGRMTGRFRPFGRRSTLTRARCETQASGPGTIWQPSMHATDRRQRLDKSIVSS